MLYPNLRVSAWLDYCEEQHVKSADFTTFLKKASPVFAQGRKVSADYLDPDTDALVVRKTFSDVLTDGTLTGVDILFEWFDSSDQVGLTKTVHKPLDGIEAWAEEQKRRRRAIEQLIAGAKGTTVENDVREIFIHYETEVKRWYELGGNQLGDAIAAESDATILGYLDEIPDPVEFPGQTTRDRIYYQIGYDQV